MNPNRFIKQSLLSMLVAGCSPMEQQRIGRALKALCPALRITYVLTTQLAADYLHIAYEELYDIPSLLLLDAGLISSTADWQWLRRLTTSYPLLIVVVLTQQGGLGWVANFYQQGIHAVLIKPEHEDDWSEWATCFVQYWDETASMPRIQF